MDKSAFDLDDTMTRRAEVRVAAAWGPFFSQANVLFSAFRGMDRSLSVCIMQQLLLADVEGKMISAEDLEEQVGSYASLSTVRRYLRMFHQRGLVLSEERSRRLVYSGTPQLHRIAERYAELIRKVLLPQLQ
jgi:hypothetical protein